MDYQTVIDAITELNDLKITKKIKVPKKEIEGEEFAKLCAEFIEAGQEVSDDDQDKVPDSVTDVYNDLIDDFESKSGVFAITEDEDEDEDEDEAPPKPKKGKEMKPAPKKEPPKKEAVSKKVAPKKEEAPKTATKKDPPKPVAKKAVPPPKKEEPKNKPVTVKKEAPAKEKKVKEKKVREKSGLTLAFEILAKSPNLSKNDFAKKVEGALIPIKSNTCYLVFRNYHIVADLIKKHGLPK
jgi:hypothetical protein